MRLFIAIEPDDSARTRIAELRDTLRSRSQRGRFTRSENIHLTLAFLGECDNAKTEKVKMIMDSLEFERFRVSMDRIGRFRRDGGDIWWVGIAENRTLTDLRNALVSGLKKEGIDIDERFDAHITIGREIRTDERPHNTEEIRSVVSSLCLMRSDRIDNVLRYTAIYKKEAES
ncbi:MAG: RNA 2',3'-cyclic phosphodiesterase [Methanomassiliicoccaceae archaeon]|nr:RNA 2',3'-cyclic phosphodiesterase [Methanomassiliicoccaceae archaeon]